MKISLKEAEFLYEALEGDVHVISLSERAMQASLLRKLRLSIMQLKRNEK